jgi:histidinol-phosphate phosphatase family protein
MSDLAPAVFLDKDGTLVEDVPYNVDPARMQFLPGVAEGLRSLHDAGYRLLVVSNQSGVARGYFEEPALRDVEARLRELFHAAGSLLTGFYYCPHHPAGEVRSYRLSCQCRKPRPGLVHRAAREHGIDVHRSWLVGDILDDVEAGRRAGCRTILLHNGHETEWLLGPHRRPHHTAADFREAVSWILTGRQETESDMNARHSTIPRHLGNQRNHHGPPKTRHPGARKIHAQERL